MSTQASPAFLPPGSWQGPSGPWQDPWPFNTSRDVLLGGNRRVRCRHRRNRASSMEKQRQERINEAIARLRQVVPEEYAKGERLTKARTLRMAAEYMNDLVNLLASLDSQPNATSSPFGPVRGTCWPLPGPAGWPSPVAVPRYQPPWVPCFQDTCLPHDAIAFREFYSRSVPQSPRTGSPALQSCAMRPSPQDMSCARYLSFRPSLEEPEQPFDLAMPKTEPGSNRRSVSIIIASYKVAKHAVIS